MRRALLLVLLCSAATADAQYSETYTVERILLDIRVVQLGGGPLGDLAPEDFEVRIGGRVAPVESVMWVDDTDSEPELEATTAAAPEFSIPYLTQPAGRLIVVFIQTDFTRNSWRVEGHMKFMPYAEDLIRGLEPADRVAVFSFDSHLKFRLDFTADKERVIEAMRDAIRIDLPEPPPPVREPTLAPRLDRRRMQRARSSEAGLRIVGEALRPIDGPKTLLLMGWGLGQRAGKAVKMRHDWPAARDALLAARVTLHSLDTTFADLHDLEAGLKQAAADTGGFYVKTHVFPEAATERVRRTMSGHIELELRRPEGLKRGSHPLEIRIKRRGATVLAPTMWVDR